jgi:transposase
MIEQKVNGQKRRKYDTSFKEEVLKMILNGRPVPEIAQSLGIGENLIYKWKSRSSQPSATAATATATGAQVQPVGLAEQQALHKRIRELETERDILKKALAIFSRPT